MAGALRGAARTAGVIVVARLIGAVGRLKDFPQSGRMVPEFEHKAVREIVERPYRIVYRLVREDDFMSGHCSYSARSL